MAEEKGIIQYDCSTTNDLLEIVYNIYDGQGLAMGTYSTTTTNSIAMGGSSTAENCSIAMGSNAKAIGSTGDKGGSIAIGSNSNATNGSIAIGAGVTANNNSIAVDYTTTGVTTATNGSIAIGANNNVTGSASCAIGLNNTATSQTSFCIGDSNYAGAVHSLAMGTQSYSMGDYTMTLGRGEIALTDEEIASINSSDDAQELYESYWDSSSTSFHMAYGEGSAVFGHNNLALGAYSLVTGTGNISYENNQVIVGKYNAITSSRGFIIANGTNNDDRKNTVSFSFGGNGWMNGTLTQGSDARLKENIKDLEVKGSLRLVEFDRKDFGTHSYGFIADEVEEIYPDVVNQDNGDDLKYLDYNAAICIKLAELEGRIKELENNTSATEAIGESEE